MNRDLQNTKWLFVKRATCICVLDTPRYFCKFVQSHVFSAIIFINCYCVVPQGHIVV